MSYIGNKPATNFETVQKQISTSNSGTTITLDRAVTNVQDILLTIDAVVQSYDNYSVSGTTLTVGGTLNNNRVEILYVGRTMQSVDPTDDSVSASSIKTDAVTTAKVQNDAITVDKLNLISTSSVPSLEAKGDGSSQDGYIQLNCSQNSHGIKLKSPPHSAGASYTLTFPNNDGDANQFLQTDGNGVLSFASISGTLGNFSATEFTTSTFSSVSGNSNETHDFTSNLAVGYYLVEINTRGYATSDTNGIQVTANATSNHTGITMYALSPNSSGGSQGTRLTLASRREFWNVTSSTNSFRSSHGNVSMWSSAHQTIPNMQGKVRVVRIA